MNMFIQREVSVVTVCMVNQTAVEQMTIKEDRFHSKRGKWCHRVHDQSKQELYKWPFKRIMFIQREVIVAIVCMVNQTAVEQMSIEEEFVQSNIGNCYRHVCG